MYYVVIDISLQFWINKTLFYGITVEYFRAMVKTLFWIISNNKLNTRANLVTKGWQGDPRCPHCNLVTETQDHLFIHYPFAGSVWSSLLPHVPEGMWNCRNNMIFRDIQANPSHIASNIARYTMFWTGAEDDRLARRLRRAAHNLKLQDIAKENVARDIGDNFSKSTS
ncbi:uncharacterized protein LOC109820963 [Asparagus officinalis]|uniref:uncharacterized protein LOC109820963 n=1 Tax=Asparagus officinalis TaxID=4686 RepID=UPI00098E7B24|nr:uncharacterized protein LOC109820963 [Asparagus officinalis]